MLKTWFSEHCSCMMNLDYLYMMTATIHWPSSIRQSAETHRQAKLPTLKFHSMNVYTHWVYHLVHCCIVQCACIMRYSAGYRSLTLAQVTTVPWTPCIAYILRSELITGQEVVCLWHFYFTGELWGLWDDCELMFICWGSKSKRLHNQEEVLLL